MTRRDLARERLQTIRSLQGWREAYKVAGLTQEGSDATKRRRLSRLINRKTTGAKKLDAKQRRKINRTFKTKTRRKALDKGRTDQQIKAINKVRAEARKKARATFGANRPSSITTRLPQSSHLPPARSKAFLFRAVYALPDRRTGFVGFGSGRNISPSF